MCSRNLIDKINALHNCTCDKTTNSDICNGFYDMCNNTKEVNIYLFVFYGVCILLIVWCMFILLARCMKIVKMNEKRQIEFFYENKLREFWRNNLAHSRLQEEQQPPNV